MAISSVFSTRITVCAVDAPDDQLRRVLEGVDLQHLAVDDVILVVV